MDRETGRRVDKNFDDIEKLIRTKILERTGKGVHEIRQAYNVFGRPAKGISFESLKMQLRKFGLILDDEDLRAFFRRWDKDGNGVIDFYEFIHGVLPNDYPDEKALADSLSSSQKSHLTTNLWGPMNSIDTSTPKSRPRTSNPAFSPLHKFPASLSKWEWTTEDMERIIRQKILERGQSSKDLLQQAYSLFGRPIDGLTYDNFRSTLVRKFGLPFTEEQLKQLFTLYDKDSSGTIDFYEFIHHVMPKDYTSDRQWQHGEEHLDGAPSRRAIKSKPKMHSFEWSHRQIRGTIQRKIQERGQNSKDLLRQAYFLFGRPQNGITFEVFKNTLYKFGLEMPEEDLKKAFEHYDGNGNGILEFHEFIREVMPTDYPGQVHDEALARKQLSWWKQKDPINRVTLSREKPNITLNLNSNSPARAKFVWREGRPVSLNDRSRPSTGMRPMSNSLTKSISDSCLPPLQSPKSQMC